ncbi:MAG: flagellar FlbD family protein [Acidimicrobiales bacterium]
MIVVTTLKGERLAINDELIERVEDDHPTRVILTSGTCYMVAESVEEVVRRCQEDRAAVHAIALRHADHLGDEQHHGHPEGSPAGPLRASDGDSDENIVRLDRHATWSDGQR